ncbi:CHAT domain containing protein [Hyaloscypha variabilis]
MAIPLHVAIGSPPSTEKVPQVVVEAENVPRTQPVNLKGLDESLSFDNALRGYSQICASPDGDDDETFHQDSQFVATSIDDVCACSETENESEQLASYLPSKIVFETRNKCRDAVRLGSNDDGIEALESGLQTLRKNSVGTSDYWRLGEAEILLDLGRKVEAREALAHCDVQPRTRGSNLPIKQRPQLRESSSASDAMFEEEMLRFNNQSDQEELLEVSLRAEDWVKARETAENLHHIDPSFFNIQTKMDRYRKCRQILMLGSLEETPGPGADTGKALRLYNHGCFATELFHKHFDPPRAQVNGLDHNDCANLFFSAARVCVLFHQNGGYSSQGRLLTPEQFTLHFKGDLLPCSPPLTERDWKHQALHFMEQGRSRALLESILKGDPEEPLVTAMQRKYLMADVAWIARETIRIKKKRDYYLMAADSRSLTLPSPANHKDSPQDYALLGLNNDTPSTSYVLDTELEGLPRKKTRSLALGPLLDTAGLDDYKYAQMLPSPSSVEESDPGSVTKERAFAKSKAQMRWQKAFLYALAMCNPTLNAAIQGSSFARDASSIKAKIPADTAVIEYALVTAPPEGLISIVITSDGIEECAWQKLDTVKLQNSIAGLLSSMQSPNPGSRNSSPISPRRREPTSPDQLRDNLASILLQPIEKCLSGKKKLIIIPSGELAHVPWAMLLHTPVSIVPSLSIWEHLHSHSRETQAPSKVSVVGNPPRNEDGSLRDPDIPYSYMEAFYIARLNKDVPFLAGENNRKRFQEWVSRTRVLHLCAHSTFDDQDPSRSGIKLFKDQLTIHDWRDLAIKADLVVFSSCLSGISKAFYSGSAFGFAHALLGTGTRSFIGSLWPVDDQATLLLMMIFYEGLRTLSPAEALHNAQKKMRNLSQNDVWDLVEKLKMKLKHPKVGDFVDRPRYWIKKLDNISAEDLQNLREQRCWAAFVLTGYGFQNIRLDKM